MENMIKINNKRKEKQARWIYLITFIYKGS